MSQGIFGGAADEGIFGLGALGTNGSSVLDVQQSLIAAGFDVGPTGADGVWGPCTAAAVREFISRHGEQPTSEKFGADIVRRARTTTGTCRRAAAPAVQPPQREPVGPGITVTPGERLPPSEEREPAPGLDIPGLGLLTQWWFWLAVAGVAGVGFVGIRYYQKRKEEEERAERMAPYGAWA